MMALLRRRLQLCSFGSFSLLIFVLKYFFCWTKPDHIWQDPSSIAGVVVLGCCFSSDQAR